MRAKTLGRCILLDLTYGVPENSISMIWNTAIASRKVVSSVWFRELILRVDLDLIVSLFRFVLISNGLRGSRGTKY
jgi:hypothetical protein